MSGKTTAADGDVQVNTISDVTGVAISIGAETSAFTALVTSGAAKHSVVIRNNVNGSTGAWMKVGTYAGGLWVEKNRFPNSTVTLRTLTIVAGVIEVFF